MNDVNFLPDVVSKDVTSVCQEILRMIQSVEARKEVSERFTANRLVEACGGRGKSKTTSTEVKKMSALQVQRIITEMLIKDYIK